MKDIIILLVAVVLIILGSWYYYDTVMVKKTAAPDFLKTIQATGTPTNLDKLPKSDKSTFVPPPAPPTK